MVIATKFSLPDDKGEDPNLKGNNKKV